MLIITAYIDHKTKELNLWVILAGFVLSVAGQVIMKDFNILWAAIGLAVGVVPFLIPAILKRGGGGDVILMGACGFVLNAAGICYLIVFSIGIYILFGLSKAVIAKQKGGDVKPALKAQYPFAPFVLFGWVIYLILAIVIR